MIAGRVSAGPSPTWFGRNGPSTAMALATAVLMAWGLGRPAFWLDEDASVCATRRSWSHLLELIHGPEAPHVPYYLLLKAYIGVVGPVAGATGTAGPLEVLYRLPSAAGAVVAGWVLVRWLHRTGGARLASATGAALLVSAAFSRYGQEVRAYSLVMAAATLATIAWTAVISRARPRHATTRYAGALIVAVALNPLAVLLLPAHLTAALVAPDRGARARAWRRTVPPIAGTVVVTSPLILFTVGNATGPITTPTPLTFGNVSHLVVQLFTTSGSPLLGTGAVLLLALVGVAQVRSRRHAFLARLAICWTVTPIAGLVVAVVDHPNLMIGRYVLFLVPGAAILAGLGVVTVMDLVHATAARPAVGRAGSVLTGAAAIALLFGVTLTQSATLTQMRAPWGHGNDPRPIMVTAARPENAHLPIVVSSDSLAIALMAYHPAQADRLITHRPQWNRRTIWALRVPPAQWGPALHGQDRVVVFLSSSARPGCQAIGTATTMATAENCLPSWVAESDYHVASIGPDSHGLAVVVVQKDRRGGMPWRWRPLVRRGQALAGSGSPPG